MKEIFDNKKGEMPWWLRTLIIVLIIMVIVIGIIITTNKETNVILAKIQGLW